MESPVLLPITNYQNYPHPPPDLSRFNCNLILATNSKFSYSTGLGEQDSYWLPKATGKMEKVGEYECEIYTWEGKLGTGKFWVAKDFPNAKELNELQDKMMKSMGSPMASLVPQNSDFPGIVVKSEMTVMGKLNISELVSAKQEPVSDDVFKTPEGYQEMKTPGLPGK